MRLCRFNDDRLGLVCQNEVFDVSAALDWLPSVRWPVAHGDLLIRHLDIICDHAEKISSEGGAQPLSEVILKSPVANPTKVIGAPVNYYAHRDEASADSGVNFGKDIKTIDEYGLFLKSNVLVGPSEGVALHHTDRRNDHEIELCAIIGKEGKNIGEDAAMDHVAGYAIGLDMTLRGTEDRSLRKSIDSYSVMGPWIVTKDEIGDPDNLGFSLHVNGELRQKSDTNKLIFNIRRLIDYASTFYTLYPGDVIMTGTPEGVGPVEPGDVMQCWMQDIGDMVVRVRPA